MLPEYKPAKVFSIFDLSQCNITIDDINEISGMVSLPDGIDKNICFSSPIELTSDILYFEAIMQFKRVPGTSIKKLTNELIESYITNNEITEISKDIKNEFKEEAYYILLKTAPVQFNSLNVYIDKASLKLIIGGGNQKSINEVINKISINISTLDKSKFSGVSLKTFDNEYIQKLVLFEQSIDTCKLLGINLKYSLNADGVSESSTLSFKCNQKDRNIKDLYLDARDMFDSNSTDILINSLLFELDSGNELIKYQINNDSINSLSGLKFKQYEKSDDFILNPYYEYKNVFEIFKMHNLI